jgi:signal transduction histidine kinase
MNRNFFKNISLLAIASLVMLATVQCVWVVRMYNDQVLDFCRRVESATYKSIYKAFRMDAVPGIHNAERIRINLDEFDLYFVPNLLELDITEPYYAEILSLPTKSGEEEIVLMRHGNKDFVNGKLHTVMIIIDDDSLFALRLSINIPYREFWGSLKWIVLSSAAIVVLLAAILIYILKTMFRQKTLEQMRRDFTHNITHELKTPIAVASAATDALVNFSAEADPHRRRRYLQIIGKQLGELSSMVERILSVSVEGKEEKMEMEGISLFPIIHSTVEEISMGLENPPEIGVTCGKDIEIYGDRFHLKNVMATLIDNAVKYGCGEDAAKGECGEGCGINHSLAAVGTNVYVGVGIAALGKGLGVADSVTLEYLYGLASAGNGKLNRQIVVVYLVVHFVGEYDLYCAVRPYCTKGCGRLLSHVHYRVLVLCAPKRASVLVVCDSFTECLCNGVRGPRAFTDDIKEIVVYNVVIIYEEEFAVVCTGIHGFQYGIKITAGEQGIG